MKRFSSKNMISLVEKQSTVNWNNKKMEGSENSFSFSFLK
jgi:hypothetical protein